MAAWEITLVSFVVTSVLCSPFAFWAYEAWNMGKGNELMSHWNKW